jgi:Lrp/AsnC family leucine-responsive transcriptional regulator
MMELDKIDRKILKLLQIDSQTTVKDIANRVGLSTTPVFERIKRLEKKGFIKKYVAIVDKEKLNKGLTVFSTIVLKDHSRIAFRKFEADVSKFEEVLECYIIAGNADYLLKIVVGNMKEYNDFATYKIGGLENVSRSVSSFVMAEVKDTNVIPV